MDNQRQKFNSLSAKITILCGMVALVGMVGVIWMNTLHARTQAFRSAEMQLQKESRTISSQFDRAVQMLVNDVELLSLSPEIRSLMQQMEARQTPYSKTELEAARAKTEMLFQNVMYRNPEFLQLRLIGLDKDGKEIVRVNRFGEALEVVQTPDLQNKGREPYMLLARSLPNHDAAFSRVTYNREFGRIEDSRTPALRALATVQPMEGGRPAGVIVINVDYKALIEKSLAGLPLDSDVIIANDEGDVFCFDAETKTGELFLRYEVPDKLSRTVVSLQTAKHQALFKFDDRFYFVSENAHEDSVSSTNITLYQSVPPKFIFAEVISHFFESAALIGVLMASLLAVATVSATWLTTPLRNVAKSLRHFHLTRNADLLDLPVHRQDEVGELSLSFRDVLKELERERHQKDKFFEHGVDGFAVLDENGIILTANQACSKLFGYEPHELLGQNVSMLMPDKHARNHDSLIKNYKYRGEPKIIGIGRDVDGMRKDGSTFPIGLAISHFKQGDETYFCGTIRDITQRKHNEQMKDEFVSTVNHELRTPLTSIYGSLDLLQRISDGKLDKRSQRLLTLAFDGCSRLTHLVNDILDLEKISAGKMEYRFEKVNLRKLVEDVVANNESLAEKFETQFQVQHFGENAQVNVDPNRFSQALLNLLSNAAKFTEKNTVVSIETRCTPDKSVRVSVTDNGPGIPDDFKDRIFQKFSQANGSTVTKVPGSGLGLNITKQIVVAFGGDVWFETEVGRGTTFHIELPSQAEREVPQQVA